MPAWATDECVGESQVRRTRQVEDRDRVVDAPAPVPGGRVVRRGAGRHAQRTESDGQPHRRPTYATDQTAVGVHEGDDHDGRSEGDAERLDGHPGRRVLLEAGAQPRGGGRDAAPGPGPADRARRGPAGSPRRPRRRTPGPGGRPAPARGTRRTAPGSRTRPRRRRRWPRRGPRARARGQARSGAGRGCPPWAHHRARGPPSGMGRSPTPPRVGSRFRTTPKAPSVSFMWSPAPRVSAAVAFALLAGTLSACAEPVSGPVLVLSLASPDSEVQDTAVPIKHFAEEVERRSQGTIVRRDHLRRAPARELGVGPVHRAGGRRRRLRPRTRAEPGVRRPGGRHPARAQHAVPHPERGGRRGRPRRRAPRRPARRAASSRRGRPRSLPRRPAAPVRLRRTAPGRRRLPRTGRSG